VQRRGEQRRREERKDGSKKEADAAACLRWQLDKLSFYKP